MKRVFSALLIIGLLTATLTGGAPAGATTRSAAMMRTAYSVTLLAPMKNSKVTGAVAVMTSTTPGMMTVAVTVSGLKPNTTHAEHIHSGSCANQGPVVYPLANLVADAQGDAMAISTIKVGSAPTKGFYVNVHDTDSAMTVLACGNLHNPTTVVSLNSMNGTMVKGMAFITEPAPVLGSKMTMGTEVIVWATGLQPKQGAPDHIHAGPCNTVSGILYPLNTLVANAKGQAIAGTGITDMVPLSGGLSLHTHLTTMTMSSCGNITTSTNGM
jgi:hypothetical protein